MALCRRSSLHSIVVAFCVTKQIVKWVIISNRNCFIHKYLVVDTDKHFFVKIGLQFSMISLFRRSPFCVVSSSFDESDDHVRCHLDGSLFG